MWMQFIIVFQDLAELDNDSEIIYALMSQNIFCERQSQDV